MKKTCAILIIIVVAVAISIFIFSIRNKTNNNLGTVTDVNCNELEKNIFSIIDQMQFCENDSDCIIDKNHRLNCPFGCYIIKSKIFDNEEVSSLLDESLNQFIDNCPICKYECPIEPTSEDIACLNNRCADIRFENSNDNVLSIDDWDWDSGQNCNGFTVPKQCEELEWPISYGCRKANIYNCYECLAEKNTEPSICENIILDDKESEDFWQDNCYWRLVIKYRDTNSISKIDFCDKFVEQGHRKACYDIIK